MTPASSIDTDFKDLLLNSAVPDDTTESSIRSKVILTEYRGQHLAFPSHWVDEVLFVPRQQVLKLPFYRAPVLGVLPHQGHLVLLIEPGVNSPTLPEPKGLQDHVRAMRLSAQAGDLAGVAILIEKIVGTLNEADLENQPNLRLFTLDDTSVEAFQPYRWV